jgi:hypothetical protein
MHAYPSHESVYRERCEEIAPQTQVHQEQQRTHQVNPALTSSQFILQDLPQHPQTSLSQSSLSLLKVPYPNLTLTLALIYVDRLKAVRGGCIDLNSLDVSTDTDSIFQSFNRFF